MTSLKKTMFILTVVIASVFSYASAQNSTTTQVPDSTSIIDVINNDSTSTIEIIQPQELNERIIDLPKKEEPKKIAIKKTAPPKKEKKEEIKKGKHNITPGKRITYTIIAFSKPNQRDKAKAIAQQINSKFPGYRARVTSNLPYWQVSCGPFFDEGDAKKAVSNIRSAIPGTTPSMRKKNTVVK